jgi:putative transferase (TIGR04331 family)
MLILRPEATKLNEIGIQDSEIGEGVKLTTQEILRFSNEYSQYSNYLILKISNSLRENYLPSIPLESLKVLTRRALVPIIHFYWNFLLRINHFSKLNSDVFVAENKIALESCSKPEDFEVKAISLEWNEWMLGYLAPIWNFQILKEIEEQDSSKDQKSNINSSKNFLFSLGNRKGFWIRLIQYIEKITNRYSFFSKFPILTFANAEPSLRIRGMYIFFFRRLYKSFSLNECSIDIYLRKNIFISEKIQNIKFSEYLSEIGLSENQIVKSYQLFENFIIHHYPAQFLEGIANNLSKASELFIKNDRKYLFSSGDGDTYSAFSIAYAKGNDFKIVKAQHGGHYGYFKDNRPALDIELPSVDIFLTWGWTRMHEGKQLEHIKCIPLPSPWLSERRKYLKRKKHSTLREYDLLWMPQMMKRFTGAPQGASSIRRDVINQFSEFMLAIANSLVKNKTKTFIKPFNQLSISLMSDTYKIINDIGKEIITLSKTYDKGLSIELVSKASIVLWDQPGTGFLECLDSGIPTLVIWDRMYNEEEEWTKSDFDEMESVGIIHRTTDGLIKEINTILLNPNKWMENEDRRNIRESFCNKYALSSDTWRSEWIDFLKNLE